MVIMLLAVIMVVMEKDDERSEKFPPNTRNTSHPSGFDKELRQRVSVHDIWSMTVMSANLPA